MSNLHFRSFSQTILCGRLGQDAKLRETKSGTKMLTFSVGTSVSTKNADGTYGQTTTWHDCMLFGTRAEKLANVLAKGTVVCVQGTISYKEVELKTGYKAKSATIMVDDLQILADSKSAGASSQAKSNQAAASSQDDLTEDEIPC